MSNAQRSFPARIADLGFSVPLPQDWISHPLPDEMPDFSQPDLFLPLAIVTAPHSALVFAIAARPAYDDGTLLQWAHYLLQAGQMQPRTMNVAHIGNLTGFAGEATQVADLGPVVIRYAFFEDGGRLVNLTLTAPEMIASALAPLWDEMLRDFSLETPRGATTPLGIEQPSHDAATDNTDHDTAAHDVAGNTDAAGTAPYAPSHDDDTLAGFAEHALADDAASFDPEHHINANLRDRGVGLTPRVIEVHAEHRCAILAAGAITTFIIVPFGWHVIDDGSRTLMLHPGGDVQIHLNLIRPDGRSRDEILDGIEAETRAGYADPEFVRIEIGPTEALGIRNIDDNGVALEQYHLLLPPRADGLVLRARVTATPATAETACNLAHHLLLNIRPVVHA